MKNIFLCSYFAAVADGIDEAVKFSGKKVAFIDTAAKFEEINFYVKEARDAFSKFGAQIVEMELSGFGDLASVSEYGDGANAASEVLRAIKECDVIYVSGGNTFYLLAWLRISGAAGEIVRAVNNGKIYIGESAGAIVTAPDIRYAELMDENSANLSDFSGLNLVPFAVVPHFGEEPFTQAVNQIIAKFKHVCDLRPINNSEFIAF